MIWNNIYVEAATRSLTFCADNFVTHCTWDHEARHSNLEMSCPLSHVKEVKDSYVNKIMCAFPIRCGNDTSNYYKLFLKLLDSVDSIKKPKK